MTLCQFFQVKVDHTYFHDSMNFIASYEYKSLKWNEWNEMQIIEMF